MVGTSKISGPSGFIQLNASLSLVVDYGKVLHPEGMHQIGTLYEDGLIQGSSEPLGQWNGLKTIEELPGAVFRGIDCDNQPLELPGPVKGPTGGLKYNNQEYLVLFGRVATPDHKVIGFMTDEGSLYFRDSRFPGQTMRKMDEYSQLATFFQGIKSNHEPCKYDYQRSLHKQDKSYWENEVMRYFTDYDRVNGPQKKYVFDTMRVFASSGLLQLVRKSEGTAGLGNVKHGASGVTGVRTGNVTLDREEFEREVNFFKKFGALMAIPARVKPLIEVRINLVVAHEYGHQLEFCLSHSVQQKIQDCYQKRLANCDKQHPLPEEAETLSELVQPQDIENRVFVSGYARTSWHEYWAECVAAFAVKESRDTLEKNDPEIHAILMDVMLSPEKVVSPMLVENILNLQTSLRVGGEFRDDILKQ